MSLLRPAVVVVCWAAVAGCSSRGEAESESAASANERKRALDFLLELEVLDSAHVGAIGNLSYAGTRGPDWLRAHYRAEGFPPGTGAAR